MLIRVIGSEKNYTYHLGQRVVWHSNICGPHDIRGTIVLTDDDSIRVRDDRDGHLFYLTEQFVPEGATLK